MNVKNVEKENGSAKVTVEIAKDEFQTALDKAYAKIRKDIMIPGFRKGKAPRKFVERMYGSQVFYEDAVSEIFPDIYEAAIIKQELKAVGQPSVTDMQTPEDVDNLYGKCKPYADKWTSTADRLWSCSHSCASCQSCPSAGQK